MKLQARLLASILITVAVQNIQFNLNRSWHACGLTEVYCQDVFKGADVTKPSRTLNFPLVHART